MSEFKNNITRFNIANQKLKEFKEQQINTGSAVKTTSDSDSPGL